MTPEVSVQWTSACGLHGQQRCPLHTAPADQRELQDTGVAAAAGDVAVGAFGGLCEGKDVSHQSDRNLCEEPLRVPLEVGFTAVGGTPQPGAFSTPDVALWYCSLFCEKLTPVSALGACRGQLLAPGMQASAPPYALSSPAPFRPPFLPQNNHLKGTWWGWKDGG